MDSRFLNFVPSYSSLNNRQVGGLPCSRGGRRRCRGATRWAPWGSWSPCQAGSGFSPSSSSWSPWSPPRCSAPETEKENKFHPEFEMRGWQNIVVDQNKSGVESQFDWGSTINTKQCTGRSLCIFLSWLCPFVLCVYFPWCLCLVDTRVSSWGPWHCGRMYGDRFHQVLLMSARHEEAPSSFKRRDKRIRHLWQYYLMSARLCVRVLWGERGGCVCVCACVCNMRKACCAVHIGDIWGKLSFLLPHTLPPIPQQLP